MSTPSKAELRAQLLAARRAVPQEVRAREAGQLCGYLTELAVGADLVCAYLPTGTEPGSPEMVAALFELCPAVLLPAARTSSDGRHLPLLWGRYQPGRLIAGRFGIQEPAGPLLPASAIATAELVLVPALAVDSGGVRLGRGGGFFDRSLALCRPGTRLVAVVRDSEYLPELPGEPHDVRVTHVLTPGGGLMPVRSGADDDGASGT